MTTSALLQRAKAGENGEGGFVSEAYPQLAVLASILSTAERPRDEFPRSGVKPDGERDAAGYPDSVPAKPGGYS
jgi:hypothetical protein